MSTSQSEIPESADAARIRSFMKQPTNDPERLLRELDQLQQERDTLRQKLEATTASAVSMATPVTTAPITPPVAESQLVSILAAALAASKSSEKSEKLPDVPEYDGDMIKLDDWEQ